MGHAFAHRVIRREDANEKAHAKVDTTLHMDTREYEHCRFQSGELTKRNVRDFASNAGRLQCTRPGRLREGARCRDYQSARGCICAGEDRYANTTKDGHVVVLAVNKKGGGLRKGIRFCVATHKVHSLTRRVMP